MQELSPKEVQENFHVCDNDSCLNSYTPYKNQDGERFCLTHGR